MSYQFDELRVLFDLRVEAENESPISVGVGRGTAVGAIDNPVVRRLGIPYIPGSSIKGIMRSEAERFARSVLSNEVCDIMAPKGPRGELTWQEERNGEYRPCLICRIFGGPTYASHVYIYDVFPMDPNYRIEVRRRVSINRVTGGQHAGRLFDVEYVDPGVRWDLRMRIDNLDLLAEEAHEPKVVRHILSTLVNFGLSVGGKKSIGFGLLRGRLLSARRLTVQDGKLLSDDVTQRLKGLLGT